jgi:hypothetical protein
MTYTPKYKKGDVLCEMVLRQTQWVETGLQACITKVVTKHSKNLSYRVKWPDAFPKPVTTVRCSFFDNDFWSLHKWMPINEVVITALVR